MRQGKIQWFKKIDRTAQIFWCTNTLVKNGSALDNVFKINLNSTSEYHNNARACAVLW